MAETITTRDFSETDLPEVLDLMRRSLGETDLLARTPELFRWKHLANPFGRSIVLVAEEVGRVVGLRAFMRWELEGPNGTLLRCVRAVDTATHPQFQRRGIFRRLTLEAVEVAEEQGVDLIFNTPNERSGAGYLKMGWKRIGDIGIMIRPHPLRLLRSPKATGAADVLPPARPAADLNVVDRAPRGWRTPRSAAYLQWRFGDHPTARYFRVDQGPGTAIVRPNVRAGRHEQVLSDAFGTKPAAAIRRAFRSSPAAYMAGWFSSGSPERSAAHRAGLIPVPKLRALTLVARPLSQRAADVASLDDFDLALSDLELL